MQPAVIDATHLIRTIALSLVDNVDEITVTAAQSASAEPVTVIQIRANAADIGKLIGKQGRTARSIRTILGAHAMKTGARFSLDIVESERA